MFSAFSCSLKMWFTMWTPCLLMSLTTMAGVSCCSKTDSSSLTEVIKSWCQIGIAPSFYQLEDFKNCSYEPIATLTTTYGVPLTVKEAEISLDMEITDNVRLIEEITSFNRERIPQRVVHGKGAGAHGYFEVTHDVTDVTNVALFSEIGKITPVSARFSPAVSDRGTPDTRRGIFAIAFKFYTEEGIWDFLGLTTDIFFAKDGLFFPSFFHAFFPNPQTFLQDWNSLFDRISLRPETVSFGLLLFGDPGAPASYRHIPSHTIHTFQVENYRGEMSMVRFHMLPDLGEKYLNQTEAFRLAAFYPSYYIRDLYDAIARGDYPSWTLYMQVMPESEIETAGFDIYDVTLRWPLRQFPLRPIGKVVANKNPDNYFAEVEQLAFNPGNVPPGMQGVDQMFKLRTFAYRDAQLYRLGANYNKIKVNCPISPVYTYTRDGRAPVGDNYGGIPNYYPNTFNGPVPAKSTRTRTKRVQPNTVPEATNLAQATEYYKCLSGDAKERLAWNIANLVSQTYPSIQRRTVELLGQVHPRLAADVHAAVATSIAAGLPPLGASFSANSLYTFPATSARCHVGHRH